MCRPKKTPKIPDRLPPTQAKTLPEQKLDAQLVSSSRLAVIQITSPP